MKTIKFDGRHNTVKDQLLEAFYLAIRENCYVTTYIDDNERCFPERKITFSPDSDFDAIYEHVMDRQRSGYITAVGHDAKPITDEDRIHDLGINLEKKMKIQQEASRALEFATRDVESIQAKIASLQVKILEGKEAMVKCDPVEADKGGPVVS